MFLLLALALALTFEFVNGFHDTANAVATVIYTHTLKPTFAVVWSGCWNLIGVLSSSGAVAFGVIALLPAELVINVGSGAGFAMVFALLIPAIIWNLGTWYFGLPASSSHALIGSIMGVGLANSMLAPGHVFGQGVNWAKAAEVGMALLLSPLIGFLGAASLLLISKVLIKREDLYRAPDHQKVPPRWIRALLILTCTGVSFGHGRNDGQKGMGLIMLILIGILPGMYALDPGTSPAAIAELANVTSSIARQMDRHEGAAAAAIAQTSRSISAALNGKISLGEMTPDARRNLRGDLYSVSEGLKKLAKTTRLSEAADVAQEQNSAARLKRSMDTVTRFIPVWVKVAVALALGLGTMIGWKRIVVTVGEKIGREHLTYAQGAAAEIVAMATILAADAYGLPVSTTHVLSSGVAGTMAANKSGLQGQTVRNLMLAWVLTLPVTVLLGAGMFAFVLSTLIRFGVK